MAVTGITNGYNMYGNLYYAGGAAKAVGAATGASTAAGVRAASGTVAGNAGSAAGGSAEGITGGLAAGSAGGVAGGFSAGSTGSAAGVAGGLAAGSTGSMAGMAGGFGAGSTGSAAGAAGGFAPGSALGGAMAGIFLAGGISAPKIALSATGMPLPPGSEADGEVSPEESADPDTHKKIGRKSSPEECQTCKERKYQDGSDENVSFKAAAHISPEAAGAAVRAHEGEHVSNAYKKAAEEGGKVINASVMIHTAICPECGRTYVSGGTTSTTIRYSKEENPYEKAKKAQEAIELRGKNIDYAA